MPDSGTGQKLLRSSALRGASFALHAVVSLLMTPLIVHSLGDRMYGFWTLVGAFVGYYGIMDMGVSSAVSRYVSRALGQGDRTEINRVLSTAFFLFAVVALVVLAISVGVAALAFLVVRDPAEYRVVRLLLLVLGVRMALSFPARVFAGLLNAHLRYDLTAFATIAQLVVGNGAIYLHLNGGGGVVGMSLLVLGAAVFEYLINFASALRVFPQLQLSRALAERQALKAIFSYSWKTLGAQAAGILRAKVSSFIVAAFLGVSLVTYYSIAARLIDYFTELIYSVVGNLAPVFSRYEGEGKAELIRSRFMLFTKLSVVFTVFVGASIVFYGRAFIARWMGPGFDRSYWVAVLLTVPCALGLMQTPVSCLLYGISKHHYLAAIGGIEAVINFVGGVALAHSFGLYGAAVGTSLGRYPTCLVMYPAAACREIELPLPRYYFGALLLPALQSLVPLGVYFAVSRRFLRADYGTILTLAVVQALLFAPVVYALVLTSEEKSLVAQGVFRRLRAIPRSAQKA